MSTLAVAGALALLALGVAAPANADASSSTSQTIDFDGYTLGDQLVPSSWYYQTGATKADFGFTDTSSFPDSGLDGRALRISNAITVSGRQLGTPPLTQVAGVGASAGSYNTFDASFTVASATGAAQPGTDVEVALDGGSGHPYERTGGTLYLRYVDAGLQVTWMWLPKGVDGSVTDNWRTDAVVIDPTVPHEISIRTQFRAGSVDEDTAIVSIDGAQALRGGTWAGYYMAPNGVRTDQGVGSLMFRAAASAPVAETGLGDGYVSAPAPTDDQKTALDGEGLLFSDNDYSVTHTDTSVVAPAADDPAPAPPALPTTDQPEPTSSTMNASGDPLQPASVATPATAPMPGESIDVTYPNGTFTPFEWVQFAFYSVPQFATQLQANASGGLSASIPIPASLPAGVHVLAATGATSGVVSAAAVTVAAALAATGYDATQAWLAGTIGTTILLWGVVALLLVAARRRGRSH